MKTAEEVARQLWWDMTEFHEASCDSWSKEVAKALAAFAYERASEVRAEVVLDMTARMTKLTEDAVLLARDDALEKAAKACDDLSNQLDEPTNKVFSAKFKKAIKSMTGSTVSEECAARIRALKSKHEVKP
jgi:hypothetical protein